MQIRLVNHLRTMEERDEMERQLNIIRELEAGLITAKEQAEYHRELAEHSSRAKSEFLSRMSHEMRTPMNVIMGLLQITRMRGVPDNIREYLDDIDKNASGLLELINDVLDISVMEHGAFKLTSGPFDIKTTFKDVLETAGYNAGQKKQTLSSSIDPEIPATLIGDENRFKQVIGNLLANAVKYSGEDGVISFDARLHGGLNSLDEENNIVTLQIKVEDNGIGISEEHQKSLFTIFEQADGGSTRKQGGIGLGLALSKRIVEMMGGNMWVTSEPGKGSKFTFTCRLGYE